MDSLEEVTCIASIIISTQDPQLIADGVDPPEIIRCCLCAFEQVNSTQGYAKLHCENIFYLKCFLQAYHHSQDCLLCYKLNFQLMIFRILYQPAILIVAVKIPQNNTSYADTSPTASLNQIQKYKT